MSDIILLSSNDYRNDDELKNLLTVPYTFLDAAHPSLTKEQRKRVLKEKYHNKLISDGLETGLLELNRNGELIYRSKQSESVFKGFVFEALLVRLCNDNMETIGKTAYQWCTERQRVRSDSLNKIKAFGRGFITTRQSLPQLYNITHRFDVQFYYMNEQHSEPEVETIVNTRIEAGIQVKAITCNEQSEIIDKILNNTYAHVLTCLRHNDGILSYNKCMRLIRDMYSRSLIDRNQRVYLESRIYCPEQLSIRQSWIDDYSEYVSDWYRGYSKPDDPISDAQGSEIKGYKNENSILVPV